MSNAQKKNTLSREEARALYDDLKRRMAESVGSSGETLSKDQKAAGAAIAQEIRKALNGGGQAKPASRPAPVERREAPTRTANIPKLPANRGNIAAVLLVLVFVALKVTWSGLEASGIATATLADASFIARPVATKQVGPNLGREEVEVLKTLDARRAELEDKAKKIDVRADDLTRKEMEFAAKLTEIRDLTDKLKLEREKDEKHKNGQLDQLANVYGSMSPQEAAQLMEQLDETIALQLIERMPEKRVGQILALMTPQRALSITRMLSGRATASN